MIGQVLSHYRILGALGAGGMGVVYLAEDERLGRKVALKFLPTEALNDQQALDRFRLEARTASSLSHPGICALYDIGVHEGAPYIVMELLKGETLRERIARGPLKIADVVDIGIQLADALEAAHAQGIVHRDIKPANVWIGEKLRVKILDFGLAKLSSHAAALSTGHAEGETIAVTAATQAAPPRIENQLTAPGTAIGTVSYMSPEQARGEDVDARTDIFSLGVVLYEMVTGRQAFGGSTSAVVFDAILNRAPVSPVLLNPDTPARLLEAINNALEKDRDLRYQTAASFEADLKRIRRDLQSGITASATQTAAVAAGPASSARTTAQTAAAAAATIAMPAASGGTTAVMPAAGRPAWMAPAVVVALLAAGGGWYMATRSSGAPVTAGDEVTRAQARLNARDYRAALAEATAALAHDPSNGEAARVKTAAEAGLARLDSLLANARESLAANDPVAAARAVASAQALAPGDAQVAELAAQIGQRAPSASTAAPAAATATTPTPAPAATSAPRPTTGTAAPAPARDARPTPATTAPASAPATPAPAPAAPAPAPVAVAPPPAPATTEPARAPETFTPRPASPERRPAEAAPAATPARDSDDTLVRRVLDTYVRAIENKDIALFRSVRPALSADEERRLRASFAQIERQSIELKVDQLTITGDAADARVTRVDTVQAGGRAQTSRSNQTIRLARRGGSWVIVELGR